MFLFQSYNSYILYRLEGVEVREVSGTDLLFDDVASFACGITCSSSTAESGPWIRNSGMYSSFRQ